ncbi:probable chitinase 10 [Dermacentor albipictus]|uniref:probable chitinase 10 n=1 Tax=Dermacentor albipictus TaxID=60249 RepID=UPI0038FC935B
MAVPVLYPTRDVVSGSPTSPESPSAPPSRTPRGYYVSNDWRGASSRTHSKTNIKIKSPLLSPEEQSDLSVPSQGESPMMSPHLTQTQSPVEIVSPQGSRVGYSFDSDESHGHHQRRRPGWQLLWMLLSVAFITLLIPLLVFLLPYTRMGHRPPNLDVTRVFSKVILTSSTWPATQMTTPGLPRETFDPDENFLLPPGETILQFCRRKIGPELGPPPPHYRLPAMPPHATSPNDIQLRPVICVLNAKYRRSREEYLPSHLPLDYCSSIVVYSYAVHGTSGEILRKYRSVESYADALRTLNDSGRLKHRTNNITVYFTVGGEREDSANLSLVASNYSLLDEFRKSAIRHATRSELWKGINVDWNYPGDPCSSNVFNIRKLFFRLISWLNSSGLRLIVSVPPVKSRLSRYSLPSNVTAVDYVIIKTHTHTAPPPLRNVVRCSGDQRAAADVFNAALSTFNMTDTAKLGYSISVGPETFKAPAAQLGAPVLGMIKWDNNTRQPGRTSYASVCHMPVLRNASHPQCFIVGRWIDSQSVHVATFANETALQQRMNRTYADQMAMAPVAVFDIDLDDFEGKCTGVMSPLIRAVATGPG